MDFTALFDGPLAPYEVVGILVALTLAYTLLLQVTGAGYYSQLYDVKDDSKGEIYGVLENELFALAKRIELKGWNALSSTPEPECNGVCGATPHEAEMAEFASEVTKALTNEIRGMVKTRVKKNGYHNKKGDALTEYVGKKSQPFYDRFYDRVQSLTKKYEGLKPHLQDIITPEDMREMYGRVIKEAIRVKAQERARIKAIKRYPFLGKIVDFIVRRKLIEG